MTDRNRYYTAAHKTRAARRIDSSVGVQDDSGEARLGRKVTVKPNGCWAFNNDLDTYGQLHLPNANRPVIAHRFAYEAVIGTIPDGHHLHHTCFNPGCVNPHHLVPLTPSDHSTEHARLRRTA